MSVRLGLRRGDEIEIRSLAEIRATLDAGGRLDGIPFMPEMERFAGARARVWRRADRVCVEKAPTMRRLESFVFLEDLRCDGSAHGGCQRACLLLWHEAWLRRLGERAEASARPAPAARPAAAGSGALFSCQSTDLCAASRALPSWRLEQYARDVLTGNLTVGELTRSFWTTVEDRLRRLRSWRRRSGRPSQTPTAVLGLAPGDWVEVKSLAEIEATLDMEQKNRGLEFSCGMEGFCGRRFRVRQRVDRIIIENTGELRELSDTVLLEGANCDGFCSRGCPRANPLYWREIWLRRLPRGESEAPRKIKLQREET